MGGATDGVTIAGGHGPGPAAHQLDHPGGLCVGKDGDVYIADSRNHRVIKCSPQSTMGVVVAGGRGKGTAAHQLSTPYCVATDNDGALHVLEILGNAFPYPWKVSRWGAAPALQGTWRTRMTS